MSINSLFHYSKTIHNNILTTALQKQHVPSDQVEWVKKTNDIAPYDQHVSFFMFPIPIDFIRMKFKNHPLSSQNKNKTVFEHQVKVHDIMTQGILGWKVSESPKEIAFRQAWPWVDDSEDEIIEYRRQLHVELRKNGLMGGSALALNDALKQFANYNILNAYKAAYARDPDSTLYAKEVVHLMLYTDKPISVSSVTPR